MAIIDRIKFDGSSNGSHWLVYKCPSEQFVIGSQLIVNEGQEALFFKGGKALDLFGPNTHTLSTGNLPILNKLVNLPFGGKTPFSAEVYFINKTANLEMKWGTSTPIPLEDPKYGLILNIGARGQYGITINDSRLFVTRIIGAVPGGTITNPMSVLRYFNGVVNSKIKSVTAAYMIQKRISFLEISQFLSELSSAFQDALNDEFDRFGIELVNFYCESIAPNPDEYEKLRKYKEELALGHEFYQQRRSLDILEKFAENQSAGGAANAGIGLGMGLASAGNIGSMFAEIEQNMNTAPANAQITCTKCGTLNNSAMKFCGNCGNKLADTIICPHCGKEVQKGMKFCGECGGMLCGSKCPACGFDNNAGMKFCGNCGKKL